MKKDIVERGSGCKLLRLRIAGAVFIRGRGVQDRETSQIGQGVRKRVERTRCQEKIREDKVSGKVQRGQGVRKRVERTRFQ